MDFGRFTDKKSGKLIPINTELSPDWAFVPDFVPPPAWQLPIELFDQAMEAWGCLNKLDGIGHTLPDPGLLLRPLEDREAIQSSKLEGTHATAKDLLLFAQNLREPSSQSDPANAWREVFNYRSALRHGYGALAHRPLSLGLIREMHALLMKGVRGGDETPGAFRTGQVGIGTPYYRFIPPPPTQLTDLLHNFESYINAKDVRPVDKLVRPFLAHYQFETIHPFNDGNGRIGRALLALMIYKACDHRLPWLYLSPFFERNKDEYIDRLFRVSTHGEWSNWVEFCLRGTIEQAQDAIDRCAMLREVRRRYFARVEGRGSSRTHDLIERLFHSPILSVTEVQHSLKISYKTAKVDLAILERALIVRRIPRHKPISYVAPDVFAVAYSDHPQLPLDPSAPPTLPALQIPLNSPGSSSTAAFSGPVDPPLSSDAPPSPLSDTDDPPLP